ncbi:MAG: amino acid adenylation domain-containing protein [Ignavibacteria bacterium]|nr:amino acid adenylation domain-containing protein [Ignavibacteria bacterium]
MRISLIRLSEDSYRMVWTWHHLLFDGWSMTVLMEEFLKTYEALITGTPLIESEQDNFEDYIRYIGSIDKRKEEKYWSEYLSGIEESTLLPFIETASDRNRGTGLYETITLTIEEEATSQIQKYSRQNSITVNTVMQGVWSYLLHRYTGNDNITFGVVVSGRPDDLPGVEQRVGMYINTLPLHSEMNKEQSVKDWLRNIQEKQIVSRQHQYTPLNEIQGWSGVRGDLFDTIYGFENYPVSKVVSSGKWSLQVEEVRIQEQTNYPLTITIASAEQTHIKFRYNTGLLQKEFAKEISEHFENVLMQIISDEGFRVDEIELLPEAEKDTLLTGFNDTAADYPKDKTVVDLFEEQAMKTPGKTALVFGNQKLTYKELNEKSNQLAHYLRSQGVEKETLVPICIERNGNMLVAILGMLKSGSAYVPVDPDYPEERIRYMIEDTGAGIVICGEKSRQKLASIQKLNIIEADEDFSVIKNYSESNIEKSAGANDLAYVIYTSGSTGSPKGVMVEHRNLLNYLFNKKTNYITGDENTSGSFIHLSYTFDASVTGIFMPLLSGKTVVIGSKQSLEIFEDSNLEKYAPFDFMKITPGHLELLHSKMSLQNGRQLTKKLVIGGEALMLSQLSYLTEEGMDVTIVNEYGPTEATVGCSTFSFNTKEKNENLKNNISIGKPINNIRIYILGRQNEILPAGIPGEICIGGDGIARGYLNLPELSKEKFIKDPFSNEAGSRLYKSGDLGRWMPDGNIEYLGRPDEQLKIRGYRIEPGEIEECIASVSGVRNAKVIAAEGAGSKKLNAYVQIDKDKLPLLSNYEQLLSKDKIQKSNLNILPNGLPILSHNLNEVKFLYNEIFEDHCYLKHGITLNEDSVVIDIGANVGFFTVFLNALSKNIKVYSIEPIPEVYELLSANRELYNIPGKAFELAIQETEKDLDFTYYPQVSIVSGISEDIDEVKEVVRSYIENSENGELQREDVDSLLEVKLESKRIKCKAKSISQIIEEERIEKIDLLKVDVENSEHLVIDGIAEKDWVKIDSIIIEVHDTEGRLERIKQILKQRGFETYVEKEQMLSKDAILYNLFAIRDGVKKNISTMGERDKSRSAEWRDPADVVKEIKSELEFRLPDYMMPSNIILLDQFPLTKNGKIDKKALPDPDVTENLSNEYSVARNDLEEVLVEIWQELLEVESVGINDNFFELGGDSIIIIQIVSRARRAGFELQVSDIFSYQTIAKLSQAVNQRNGSSVTTSSEQGLLEGECGLLPIQQWYFEKAEDDISHFNQSVLLSIEKSVTTEMLSYAIGKMISRHDALRFRYSKKDGAWTQEYGTLKAGLIIENLKSPDKESISDLIKGMAEIYQRSLNIEKGEIVKFVLIQTPESEKENRLLIIIHHLAIDGVSWRILLEDLEILLTEVKSGVKESTVQKSSSYRQWYKALEQYGQSNRLTSQSRYWENVIRSYKPLATDKEFSGEVRLKDIHTHKILLDSKQTQKLLQEVPRVYHTEINDILLCALALTISERYTTEKIIIGLEGHGRESIVEGIDTTGTVGWFTNLYPVLLELSADSEVSDAIRNVKEQLRSVPDKGLGYGVLKYINKDESMTGKNCWEIVFNYLGQLDNAVSGSKWLSAAKEFSGTDMSGDIPVSEKLSINGFIQSGELNINWKYSSLHFEKKTISSLSEKYLNILQTLIQHCTEEQRSNVIHTPSDFGLGSEISIDELDNFLNEKL